MANALCRNNCPMNQNIQRPRQPPSLSRAINLQNILQTNNADRFACCTDGGKVLSKKRIPNHLTACILAPNQPSLGNTCLFSRQHNFNRRTGTTLIRPLGDQTYAPRRGKKLHVSSGTKLTRPLLWGGGHRRDRKLGYRHTPDATYS